MKRKMDLVTPIVRGDGLTQSKVEIDFLYIHDDHLMVYTKQGNNVRLEISDKMQAFIDKLEDKVLEKLTTVTP